MNSFKIRLVVGCFFTHQNAVQLSSHWQLLQDTITWLRLTTRYRLSQKSRAYLRSRFRL